MNLRARSKWISLVAVALLAAFVAGCGTSVERMEPTEVKDLSGA